MMYTKLTYKYVPSIRFLGKRSLIKQVKEAISGKLLMCIVYRTCGSGEGDDRWECGVFDWVEEGV